MTIQDPVDRHLAELERTLRGPARVRRSMLREARDGLHDAVAAHRTDGLAPQEAAVRAVREFGSVREIAPLYQHELVARQSRWAALLLLVAFPGMTFGCCPAHAVGPQVSDRTRRSGRALASTSKSRSRCTRTAPVRIATAAMRQSRSFRTVPPPALTAR